MKKDKFVETINSYKYKNMLSVIPLFNIFMKLKKKNKIAYVQLFLHEYYGVEDDKLTDLFLYHLNTPSYMILFRVIMSRNIFSLISYLKYNDEQINYFEDELSPKQYLTISKRHINHLKSMLYEIPFEHKSDYLIDTMEWALRKRAIYEDTSFTLIAYKMYIAFGYENCVDILNHKYGDLDYEMLYYLVVNLDTKNGSKPLLRKLLFENKKDCNNLFKQMLNGNFQDLFIHFAYFYNEFEYFINRLGTKMNKEKISALFQGRYIPSHVEAASITGDVFNDMIESYQHRYDLLDADEEKIIEINIDIYNSYLKTKYASSIPQIDIVLDNEYISEILDLSDSRNLVMGYRAGNCFRINGDAAILFRQFLKSEHMRLVSISTLEHKDFAMMLVQRNGNILIAQGIEVSKYAPKGILGRELYETCRSTLKQMMEYMNDNGDNIVGTIIGATNEHVTKYNHDVLPFLVTPILEYSGSYYNGVYNYQCLLDLKTGCNINSMKSYIPVTRYFDKRPTVKRRTGSNYMGDFFSLEKTIIGLRYQRMKVQGIEELQKSLSYVGELSCSCNKDWYLILYKDGTIDGFIDSNDPRAQEEYDKELSAFQSYVNDLIVKRKVKQ